MDFTILFFRNKFVRGAERLSGFNRMDDVFIDVFTLERFLNFCFFQFRRLAIRLLPEEFLDAKVVLDLMKIHGVLQNLEKDLM